MVGVASLYPAVAKHIPCTTGNVIFGSCEFESTLRLILTENGRCVSVLKVVWESSSVAERMIDCLRGLLKT